MKTRKHAFLALFLAFSALFASFSAAATEPVSTAAPITEPETSGNEYQPSESTASLPSLTRVNAGGVINGETGEMLYSVNGSTPMYPAAAVKLMTALLVIDRYRDDLDMTVEITASAIADAEGNLVNLREGERLTVRQLLACLVIGGANDAALVLARSVSGSVSAFVEQMNAKAKELGMTATAYKNPTGLHHDGMVTTVEDTLTLAAALYRRSEFVNLAGRETYEIPGTDFTRERTINNRNYLVSNLVVSDYYDPSVNGMCYGSTYEAGGVAVASSMASGTLYLAAVFGGETEKVFTEAYEATDTLGNPIIVPAAEKYLNHAFFEVKELLDWAKSSFDYFEIVGTADVICEIPVKLGDGRNHITLFPENAIELYLPRSADLSADIRTEFSLISTALTAPVSAGTQAGTLSVYYRNELMAQVPLVTRSTVDRSILDYYAEQVGDFLRSESFRKWALTLTGLLAVYALCMSAWRHRARKKALLRRRREQDERRRAEERKQLERWH